MFQNSIPGKIAIKQAAEYLMLSNGTTTTLEVKGLLREQGYLANQSEVSKWMDKLCHELDWEHSFNGRNRNYRYRLEMDFGLRADMPTFSLN